MTPKWTQRAMSHLKDCLQASLAMAFLFTMYGLAEAAGDLACPSEAECFPPVKEQRPTSPPDSQSPLTQEEEHHVRVIRPHP